jgi:hypothetical protein
MSEENISDNKNERLIFETECESRRNNQNLDPPITSFEMKKFISIDKPIFLLFVNN